MDLQKFCDKWNVTPELLRGRNRTKHVNEARHLLMYQMWMHGKKLRKIGAELNRNDATVCLGIQAYIRSFTHATKTTHL